jgi:hypothetical protein
MTKKTEPIDLTLSSNRNGQGSETFPGTLVVRLASVAGARCGEKSGLHGFERPFRWLVDPGHKAPGTFFEQGLSSPRAKTFRVVTWSSERNRNALTPIWVEDRSIDCQVQP